MFFGTCFFAFWGLHVVAIIYNSTYQKAITHIMFKAFGTILLLYAITQMMSSTFVAFENAAIATFETLEAAAVVSKVQIEHSLK
jgi:hypothetical protein